MGPLERAERGDGASLGVLVLGKVLLAGGDGRTVVDDDGDVDAHDGDDGAHVQVHQEDPLRRARQSYCCSDGHGRVHPGSAMYPQIHKFITNTIYQHG